MLEQVRRKPLFLKLVMIKKIRDEMKFENIKPEFFYRIQELVKKRYQLRPVNFTSTKQIVPYIDDMFEVFSKSYAVLSSYVDISQEQRTYFKKKFIGFVNPEYVKFVVDSNNLG